MAISLSTEYVLEKYNFIQQLVDQCWNLSGAWQEFIAAMRQTFPAKTGLSDQDGIVLRLAMLPGLCCEAAGGQFGWADPVAAAWLLLYNSAHIFDNIEDKDPLDPFWSAGNSGVAVNAASGLIFSAFLCLLELHKAGVDQNISNQILLDFSNTLLVMSGGQHQDLSEPVPNLDSWYRAAGSKSGSFFALACRSGAQLAVEDPEIIHHYSEFGYQLGLLMQLLDDVGDFIALREGQELVHSAALTRSLVVAYCTEVSPEEIQQQLVGMLAEDTIDSTAFSKLIDLLDQCGVGLFIATELEKRRQYGWKALDSARARNDGRDKLLSILAELLDSAPSASLLQ